MMKWLLPACCALLLLGPVTSFGQRVNIDTTVVAQSAIQVLQTRRGDIFYGQTQSLSRDSLVFLAQPALELHFALDQVEWLGLMENAGWLRDEINLPAGQGGARFSTDVHGHENLLYSFTAFPFSKRETEYRNIDLLFNTVDVGLGKNFSIGAGMVIPILFVARSKLAFEVNEGVHLGAGMTTAIAYGPDIGGIASHFFGIATFGNQRQYLNITAGQAIDWELDNGNPFVVTLGGSLAMGSNWRLYCDIGFSPGTEGSLPSFILSWYRGPNRLELGMLTIPTDFFIPIPIFGYSRRF